jgi:peptidyl-dipeptidase A
MFCEQPTFDTAWLQDMVGVPAGQADELAPQLAQQDTASLLAFVRWCLTIVNFERSFYADPEQDLNALWWELEDRFQGIPRPEGRDAPDWAAKVHVATAPVYYHKYLLGRLFSAQLTRKLNADLGGWWRGRPGSGAYIKRELFMPGARYPWPELVERVTGQQLGVDALASAVAWR